MYLMSFITDTLLQPNIKKKKSLTKLTEKATTKANKYVLATHGIDSEGEFSTKYVKVISWLSAAEVMYLIPEGEHNTYC